jgi:transcription initiation factor IIE alpha subunit
LLSDGKEHSLEEIQQRTKVDKYQVKRIIDFLKEYDFISIDEAKEKIKINKMAQRFLTQEATA